MICFGTVTQKCSAGTSSKAPFPLLSIKNFDILFFLNQTFPLRINSVLGEKIVDKSPRYPLRLLSARFFHTRKFLKHRNNPLPKVSILRQKNHQHEIVLPFPLLSKKTFDILFFLKNQTNPLRKNFYCEKKSSAETCATTLSSYL